MWERGSSASLCNSGMGNAGGRIWNIFVCLFVSKEFLQLGAGNPQLLLKTGEEEKAGELCQDASHSCWTLPGIME